MSSPDPPGPTLGPCTSWIDGDFVAACAGVQPAAGSDDFDDWAVEASMALFEISGRKWTGLCERTVRPVKDPCSCFGNAPSIGAGAWAWLSGPYGGWWENECGDRLGCSPMSRVKLAGYPVRDILEVLIGGEVVDPDSYRLDGYRWLTRLDDPATPGVRRTWPGCQNMSLNDDQPGTFSVRYRYGVDPPEVGRKAAAQLAYQLWLVCNGKECILPAGTTRVQRQGITIDQVPLVQWMDPKKPTGLIYLDTFLQGYASTGRTKRRPALWSPDVQPFARKLG